MTRELAERRGLRDEITFFDTTDELEKVLKEHGWEQDEFGNYLMDGVDRVIGIVKGEVQLGSIDSDGTWTEIAWAPIEDVFMIGGSLFVGGSVEI